MKNFFLSLLFVLAVAHPIHAAEPPAKVALFDGSTFNGWEGDTNKTFRIKDGAIVGGSLEANVPRNEFLRTTRSYTNFILTAKFKLLGKGANGGIQIRTKPIPNHHEVSGYQADMGDGWWGSLYDESRRNKILAKADPALIETILNQDDWNTYKIQCEGNRIQLYVNGAKTVDYLETDPKIEKSGIIAVQIHGGGPSEAWYKDIQIQELP